MLYYIALFLFLAVVLTYACYVASHNAKIQTFYQAEQTKFKGYRTLIVGALGVVLTELPDLLSSLQLIDFSAFFDEIWAKRIGQVIIILMILLRIHTTGPVGTKE